MLFRSPAFTMEDHRRLHDLVPDSEGYVVVSYNDDAFVRNLYCDCYILAFTRQNTMSQKPGAKFGELLITNFDPRPIIEIKAQLSMFGDLPGGLQLVNIPN